MSSPNLALVRFPEKFGGKNYAFRVVDGRFDLSNASDLNIGEIKVGSLEWEAVGYLSKSLNPQLNKLKRGEDYNKNVQKRKVNVPIGPMGGVKRGRGRICPNHGSRRIKKPTSIH